VVEILVRMCSTDQAMDVSVMVKVVVVVKLNDDAVEKLMGFLQT
jgi:hypothetical protein